MDHSFPTKALYLNSLEKDDMFLSEYGPTFVVSQNATTTVCKYGDGREAYLDNRQTVDYVQPVQLKYKIKEMNDMTLSLISYDGKREISVKLLDYESDYDLIEYYFLQKHEIAVFVTSYYDLIYYYEYFQLE